MEEMDNNNQTSTFDHNFCNIQIFQTKYNKYWSQRKFLRREFEKNPVWKRQKIREIAKYIGLSEQKVYKWHWDHTKTIQKRYSLALNKINYVS